MSLINEYEFKKCVDRYKGDRHAIKFKVTGMLSNSIVVTSSW